MAKSYFPSSLLSYVSEIYSLGRDQSTNGQLLLFRCTRSTPPAFLARLALPVFFWNTRKRDFKNIYINVNKPAAREWLELGTLDPLGILDRPP
jgi:hypothetical protein